MIDINDTNQILAISQELRMFSQQYAEARRSASDAQQRLDLYLASKMGELRGNRATLGIQTARIMMLEEADEGIKSLFKELEIQTGRYKGLEKVIDALSSQISLIQSLIRNQVKNT